AGKLAKDMMARLNEIEFEWEPNDADWEIRIAELKAFKARHGHCDVPSTWKENPGLAGWVAQRRTFYRQGRMGQDQINFLEEMGFTWSGFTSKWERRVAQLIAYRETTGNCDIPLRYQENPVLGLWAQTVRRRFRKGKLSPA